MIPFPKMHIAESVLNRITNALSGNEPRVVVTMPPPITHDPMMQGAGLDAALSRPPQSSAVSADAAPDAQAGIVEAAATGGSPLSGLIGSGSFGV